MSDALGGADVHTRGADRDGGVAPLLEEGSGLKAGVDFRQIYATLDAAKADLFDYMERFHNPRMRRRVAIQDQRLLAVSQPSMEMGWNPSSRPSSKA